MSPSSTARNRPDTRCAWRGASLLVLHDQGWIHDGGLAGFYFRETRYLSELRLRINGEEPYLCVTGRSAPEELDLVFIHPELQQFGAGGSGLSGQEGEEQRRAGLPVRKLDLRLVHRVHPGRLHLQLRITNRHAEPLRFEIAWSLAADFADLQEAHNQRREQQAPVHAEAESSRVRFRYQHPRLPLGTRVEATGGGPWQWEAGELRAELELAPQQEQTLDLWIHAEDSRDPLDPGTADRREEHLRSWRARLARLQGPGDSPFAELVNRATDDVGSLALLEGEPDEWLAPAAGMPLYPALFGRDALVTGWQLIPLDRGEVAEAALTRLGRLQGRVHDPERDEQPGRIIQQARLGPLARLGHVPFDRYYADYASPLDFINTLGQLFAWTGDRALVERHWDAARRVLDWAREHGDRDGDGYLEYLTQSSAGPEHQGWKDSGGAIVYPDGTPAEPPLAVCEVQGYYYASLQTMAVLGAVLGEKALARECWGEAGKLKERFNRDFWMEDEGFVAMALDPDKRQVRTAGSNAGQCLATGIVSDEHVPRVVERLFRPDLFSGWGIRTLSSLNPVYNPLSYHLGSVWPVENAATAFGLRRYGFDQRCQELTRALFDLARLWEAGRTPECVGGYHRDQFPHPGAYPRANAPQAWNQSAFAMLTQALLGLFPVASAGVLLVDPALPEWIPELTLRGLRVGDARVSLRFRRDEQGASHHEVIEREGTLRVLHQPPVDDLHVGVGTRLGLLLRDLLPF